MKIKVKITMNENIEYLKVNKDDIVEVEFEDYVAAVVASEIGNATLEACKAQAVAARSFAISRGVLRDLAISDSPSTAQAYRAKRQNSSTYNNCIKGTQATKGEVLMYGDTVINSIYTAANGGRTVSAEEQWGSPYPFLIAQDDPWDKAAGYKKSGSGVGMSQRGAMYAAKQEGKTYVEILSFYYPNTFIAPDYGETKAHKVIKIAKESLGHSYVFAALGQDCTPENRKKFNTSAYPEIINKCQVLNGSKKNCTGCKYKGGRIYDCRGFTYYCLKQVGVSISSVGATTQWNTNSWVSKGTIANGLPNVVCCLFKKKGEKMSHTGLHIGDGLIIHCSGEVKYGSIEDTTWTHWAIPKGLHTDKYLAVAKEVKMMTTLRKGSKGEAVSRLQEMLNELGFNCGTPDGAYGTKTAAAVKKFQEQYGLYADGIYGKATAAKLTDVYESKADKPKQSDTSSTLLDEVEALKKSLKTLTTKVNNLEKKIKEGQ